jgi:exodeoxyribonuclease V alpha subunit
MSITVKARAIREIFHRDAYYIIAFVPTQTNRDIQLNKYGNFSCCGEIGYITVGKEYELEVREGKASNYGISYEIVSVPSMKEQSLNELSDEDKMTIMMQTTSSPRIANNILSTHPNFIYDVVMRTDEELKDYVDIKKVKGMGEKYFEAYKRILREKFTYFYFTNNEKIKQYELTVDDAKKVLKMWSETGEAIYHIMEEPYYVLIEICGRSFFAVDSLLKNIRPDLIESDQRCEAVVMDILHRNENDGSSRLNGNVCYKIMSSPEEYNCENFKNKIVSVCEKSSRIHYDVETKDLSILSTYEKEKYIAEYVKKANQNCVELNFNIEDFRKLDNGIELTDEQLKAVENFKKYNLTIIDSVAGSGKSTLAKSIVNCCKKLGLTMTLCAFTGCASMRLSETTNEKACTIHLKCLKDGAIKSDVLLVDEGSIIDLNTFHMMIKAIINPHIRIVLMGDLKQISPVSLGTPYADLVRSNLVPTASFTKVFRYGNSGIAYANTNTRLGRNFFNDDIVKTNGDTLTIMNDWSFIKRDNDEEIANEIVNQYRKLINKGVNKNDILILTAYNKGDCGTYYLNDVIQNEFNPMKNGEKIFERKISRHGKIHFKIGDIVINKKNNYSALTYEGWKQIQESNGVLTSEEVETTAVFNGQRGNVVEVTDDAMVIDFEGQLIVFNKLEAYNLLLGRVQTLHSIQGQEGKYVICAITESQSRLLNKNLLYVANSRAKVKHINIGQVKVYVDALQYDGVEQRNTWLLDLLTKGEQNEKIS